MFAVKYFYNRQICLQLTMILLTFLIHRLRRFPQIFLDLGLITSVLFFWINMARSLLIPKAVFTAETPQYDFPNLPQYHLPELRGRRGKQRTQRLIFLLFSVDPAEKAGLAGKRETTNSSPTGYKWTPKDMCFSDVFKHPGEIETEVISFLPSQQKRNNTFPLRTLRGEIPICTGWNFVNGYGIWNS